MSTKTSKPGKSKSKIPSHKQKLDRLEKSIVLFVLANPSVEDAIVGNFLNRHGYVVQDEKDSDIGLSRQFGLEKPSQKIQAWRDSNKAKAETLFQYAQKIRKMQS